LSNRKEVQTLEIIEKLLKQWKKVFVPKIIWKSIYPVELENLNSLIKWKYCMETISEDIYQWKIDIALVPWLAFNRIWNRLWRWKWFYDRFLSDKLNIYKIWLWFDFQILDKIPIDNRDIDMNLIVSD
jgi:5-formyltetrahydrofolate cyclo-ligase